MPAKSKAQFKKMAMLYKEGKISKKTFKDFDVKGLFSSLPEHAGKRKKKKR